jgi:hypothetical protein
MEFVTESMPLCRALERLAIAVLLFPALTMRLRN